MADFDVSTLRTAALAVLATGDAVAKAICAASVTGREPVGTAEQARAARAALPEHLQLPARPERPVMVPHTAIRTKPIHTGAGRAALIHALAHIELNAIDLAADAIWRFDDMPEAYYREWTQVMREEALHFGLLSDHLGMIGRKYGDLPAHNSLWEMAERTQYDVLARMALVPRTLEARGLDASPLVRQKLLKVGDTAGADIIDIILRDEIGHVAVGNRWFGWLCTQRGLDPVVTFAGLAEQHRAPRLKGPFNLEARRAAGFAENELAALEAANPIQPVRP